MTYFGFIQSSSTLLQHHLGQSALAYGALMAVPALGYLAGSAMVKRAASVDPAVARALCLGAAGLAATIGAAYLLPPPLALVACLALAFVGVGAVIPYAQAGLLGLDVEYAGLTAGFFFFLQMASGALYSALLGALHPGTATALLWAVVLPQGALTAAFALSRLRGSGV